MPDSSLKLAARKLARMASLSETFRDGVSVDFAADHMIFRRNVIGAEKRPYAIISPGDAHTLTLVGGGEQNQLRPSGSLFLYLAQDTPTHLYNDNVAAEDEMSNYFGAIIEEIADLAAADDTGSEDGTSHLAIVRMTRVAFDESDEKNWNSLGRFYFAGYLVEWGDE